MFVNSNFCFNFVSETKTKRFQNGNILINSKIKQKMKPNRKLVQEILSNNVFSLELAKILNVKQNVILKRAERYSQLLLLEMCVKFYKEQGFTEEDIFEKEDVEKN